ncbi:hypothetical protein [Burkholderia sp. HI2714]|uniref:hypothetical protein n=1 Tax=Burkholderia sp. HI2714 TaxID=2015359 RepID=UPI00117EF8F3|nr:hypothetical protein [Burkholderia sp. HI2714]
MRFVASPASHENRDSCVGCYDAPLNRDDVNYVNDIRVRVTPELVRARFGQDAERYLANKGRGGENNFKGGRYEQFFAAHRIAQLAVAFVSDGADALVEAQAYGFVDDLVVTTSGDGAYSAYQLKNSGNVSWTTGEHPIADDFRNQYSITRDFGYASIRLKLVCSDEACCGRLERDVPADISEYSAAEHFPYAAATHEILMSNARLRDDFASLHINERGGALESDEVASLLIGAWASLPPEAKVSDVYAKVRRLSPTIIRPARSDADALAMLLPACKAILDAVQHFSYNIRRGVFRWSEEFGLSGQLSYDCFDDRFRAFQDRILDAHPATLDDLLELLR